LRAKKKSSAPKAAKYRAIRHPRQGREGWARQDWKQNVWNKEDRNRQQRVPEPAFLQGKNRKKIQNSEVGRRQRSGQTQNPGRKIPGHEEIRENRAPLTALVHEIAS
jgi:hypothetical protein